MHNAGRTRAVKSLKPKDIEPGPAGQAMEWIGALFAAEAHIREHQLIGAAKQTWRITHAKPVVQRLFAWIDKQFEQQGFLSGGPFTGALAYLHERRTGLEDYLDGPKKLVIQLGRTGRKTYRHHAKPDCDLPPARHRSV
jgi:glutathione S-transferase